MALDEHRLPTFMTADVFAVPKPDNTNWKLKDDWMTPAEFTQWINRRKERLRRAMADDVSNPQHRLTWEITLAMERCAQWHLYGVRTCE